MNYQDRPIQLLTQPIVQTILHDEVLIQSQRKNKIVAEYPATERQKASWREYTESGGQLMMNIYDVFDIGTLNIQCVEKAVAALVVRHESLRTFFTLGDDGLKQVIHSVDAFQVPIEYLNCNGLLGARKMNRYLKKVTQTRFDFGRAPLFRIVLIHHSENIAILAVVMHHIISDATSLKNLKNDFFYYYLNSVNKNVVECEPLPFQLKDFAAWEQGYLKTPNGKRNLAYWLHELSDVPKFKMLAKWKRSNRFWDFGRNKNGGEYTTFVNNDLLQLIKTLAIDQRTSKLCIFYIALNVLLYYLSNQKELVIIIPISLRDRKGLDKLIGYLNTDIYMKLKMDEDLTIAKMLEMASSKYFEALDHRYHTMEVVQKSGHECCAAVLNELPPRMDLIHNFEPQFITKNNGRVPHFPFFFMLTEYQNGLRIDCNYDNKIIGSRSVAPLLESYISLLEMIVAKDSVRIADLIRMLGTNFKNGFFR